MSNDKAVLASQLQAMQVRLGMQTPTERMATLGRLLTDACARSPDNGRELVRMINAMWRDNGVPYHLIDPATGEEP
jgi:hypothetical protein